MPGARGAAPLRIQPRPQARALEPRGPGSDSAGKHSHSHPMQTRLKLGRAEPREEGGTCRHFQLPRLEAGIRNPRCLSLSAQHWPPQHTLVTPSALLRHPSPWGLGTMGETAPQQDYPKAKQLQAAYPTLRHHRQEYKWVQTARRVTGQNRSTFTIPCPPATPPWGLTLYTFSICETTQPQVFLTKS